MINSTNIILNYCNYQDPLERTVVNATRRRRETISKRNATTFNDVLQVRRIQISQNYIVQHKKLLSSCILIVIGLLGLPKLAPVTNAQQQPSPTVTIPQRPLLIRRTNSYPLPLVSSEQRQQEPADTLDTTAGALFQQQLPPSSARSSMKSPKKDFFELVVPPYENYDLDNRRLDQEVSYIIDQKRFIEAFPSRCMTSTYMEDPYLYEPGFALITRTSETRLNATAPLESIRQAGFDPNKRTTIIVHGFTQSYPHTVWLRRTRALFETNAIVGRQNLIIMDYGTAAHQSYAQVAAMASGMGSFLANFLMKLYQLGANPMAIHIVGHSLGAHVAGFAGKRIKPKIGRITALDAAGPCFGKILSNNPNDRLTPDDAYEVDAYHYDDDFLGLPGQNGQFDIYVNGGASQPGCTSNVNSMFQAMITMVFRRKRVLSESHTRSTEVATARLTTTSCQQIAYECRDYASFTAGECGRCDESNNQCFLMGFDYQYADIGEMPLRTSHPGKKLYITTGNNEPFCLQHYQILVKFEPNSELGQLAKRNKWRIQMEALDENGKRFPDITLVNQMTPNVFSYLHLSESQPTKIKSVRLQVRQSDGKLVHLQQYNAPSHKANSGPYQLPFKIFSIDVNFMSNINPKVRQTLSNRLCPVAQPPSSQSAEFASSNSIDTQADSWIYFEQCPPETVFTMMHSVPQQPQLQPYVIAVH